MNILQRIFTDYYEEIKYTLHPRDSEMEMASPAEKIECIRDIWPVPDLCFHECRQPVHAGAQIGVAADNVDGFKAGGVIEHPAPP
ncbi:hypothetical protein AALC75_25385 [Lachnospiraceae bacterium 48-42]